MLKVRKNIFETNSSSIHAICISSNNVDIESEQNIYSNGMNATLGRYGWEYTILDTPNERLSYLYTAIYDNDKYSTEYINDALRDIGINCYFEISDNNEFYYHYLDHADMLSEFLDAIYSSREVLYDFLFSEDSFVQTGNDNDDGYEEYIDWLGEVANTDGNTLYYKYN